jgi:lactate permease
MFQQILDPIAGSLMLSALCAALPLVLLFVLLGVFRVKAPKGAIASLVVSLVLAVAGWQMPLNQALSATAAGIFYGLFPILWILVNALWIYKLTVATPWFEALGRTIRSISDDLRILSILIAFCFGALLESLAGFGAPVAISAAMLMAAGMKPLKSAVVSLLANTAPVAFGAMAAPIIALNGVTGLPLHDLSSMAGRQTPFIALLVPLLLVFIVDGRRGVKQAWPVALVAGVAFAVSQFITSNYLAVELTDVVAAVVTVAAVLVMLRFWKPKETIGMAGGVTSDGVQSGGVQSGGEQSGAVHSVGAGAAPVGANASRGAVGSQEGTTAASRRSAGPAAGPAGDGRLEAGSTAPADSSRPEPRHIWMAIAPYLIIITVFSIAQIPAIKSWLNQVGTVTFHWPGLDVADSAGNRWRPPSSSSTTSRPPARCCCSPA